MKRLMAVFAFLSMASPIFATDCNTDCEGHFDKWYQGAELGRCQMERALACKTGVTNCDIFKLPSVDGFYQGAIKLVEKANEDNDWPRNANDCHGVIDGSATGVSAFGSAKFMKSVWDMGFKAAGTAAISTASIATAGAIEVTKMFCHCACKHARYKDRPPQRTTQDMYQVSMFSDERWSMWRGKNDPASRDDIYQKTVENVGGKYERRMESTFSSTRQTLTEALCKEGSLWKIGTGAESSHATYEAIRERKWHDCLFRTINWQTGESPSLNDRVFVSATNDYNWRLRTAPSRDADAVKQEVIEKLGGNTDSIRRGYFSTKRPTRTHVTCEKRPQVSGELQTTDGSIFITAGFGYESLKNAIKRAEKEFPGGSAWCKFDINDSNFGPFPD